MRAFLILVVLIALAIGFGWITVSVNSKKASTDTRKALDTAGSAIENVGENVRDSVDRDTTADPDLR